MGRKEEEGAAKALVTMLGMGKRVDLLVMPCWHLGIICCPRVRR